MDENQTLNLEGATPIDESAVGTEENNSATVPQEQNAEVPAEVEGGTSTDTVPAPFITVPFNHENLSLTQEEATEWIQIGKKSEDLLKTIRRAAALQGKSEKELIESFEKAQDDAHRAELEEKFGDDTDTINSLMELYQSKKESTVKAAESELERQRAEKQTSLETRLANEFIELQKEFPDVKDFVSLPQSVKSAAAEGRHLYDAYLRHLHTEQKKIDAANASAEAAKKASGGTLADKPDDPKNTVMNAMMEVFSR